METNVSKPNVELENNFSLNQVAGKNCSMLIRGADDEIHGAVELCNGKISGVSGIRKKPLSDQARDAMTSYVRENGVRLLPAAARELGLSVYKKEDAQEEYLTPSELEKKLEQPLTDVTLIVHNYKKNSLTIRENTKGAVLDFSRAKVKNINIGKNCHLILDLRDNAYINRLTIGDNFSGRMNLSRNGLTDISAGRNCHCEFRINDSLKCFDFKIKDVFSGSLYVKNACFHQMKIGYYCYALIRLEDNWGRKAIELGNSFRGNLSADSVTVPDIKIGDDCRGFISVRSKDNIHGSKTLVVADEFNGTLDAGELQTLEQANFGEKTRGTINFKGSPSIKVVKFEEDFAGTADFSDSQIEYIRAKKGGGGDMTLLNCNNLSLIKFHESGNTKLNLKKKPLGIEKKADSVYYRFQNKELPKEYFTPFYKRWWQRLKRYVKSQMST